MASASWFATPNSSNVGVGLNFGQINQDVTKPVEPVSADSPFTTTKVLGRSIPIVIGTGKVDGIPVIGGSTTTQVVTGYAQFFNTQAGAIAAGGNGFDSALDSFPPGSKYTTGDAFSQTVDVPQYGTQQTAQLGYLLAFDPFGDGYQLIRVEINDAVVYDAENGIGASENFRFYGGNHTAIDPITTANIGANAGAWKNFAMIFVSGFVASSAPSVKCVISNAATASLGNVELAWITNDVVSLASDGGSGGTLGAAYDIADGIIYETLTALKVPGLTQVYLSALDIDSHVELYRVPLQDSSLYVTGVANALAIRGSGFVMVRMAVPSETTSPSRIYNATTGAIVAEWREASDETVEWRCGMQFGAKYVFIGTDRDTGGDSVSSFYGVADLTLSTFDVSSDVTFDIGLVVRGRTLAGSISFFVADANTTDLVYELKFDGDTWTRTLAYDAAGPVYGLQFDPKTGYLIASVDEGGGVFRMAYVNPDTATLVDSFTGANAYQGDGQLNSQGYERFWAKPGFALLQRVGTNVVYLLDIAAKSFTTYATIPEATIGFVPSGIYDQNRQAWFYGRNDDVWTEHKLPNTIPALVPVDTFILTKVMFLGGYGPSELTFEGLSGLSGYGLVISSDTNTRTVVQSVADIYGFSYADIGSGFYFKKPGRDDTFSLDAALTTADLVFGDKSAIDSQDEATIRSVSRVELDYISRDQGYTSRPASFSMPSINNSIRVEKYSTPLVMSDIDAQTFVTEKFFELQARLRSHSFSLSGQVTLLPGDVVSVPSGTITYAVQIDSVDLNRNMVADIKASDFQTAVSTTITAVTNTGLGNTVAVSLQTQYIHLDVPLFRYSDDLGGLGYVQYGVVASRGQAGWGGGVLYRGDTSAALTALLSQAPHKGVVGVCVDVLNGPADPFGTTDASTVTVRRTSGDTSFFIDRTEAQVLAGANFAFIGAQGRWEGVGYKTAVDNGDGTFTLSGFTIRGYRGTEVFAYSHQVGDQFVMIDPSWLKSVTHPLTDLAKTKFYKAIGLSQNPSTGTVVPHTIIGAAETPYACVNLDAVVGAPDGIDLSWDYRSRLASGTNPAYFGEVALAFQVDIYAADGVTYKRTLTSATGSVHYATADVVTDFGSDPPTELFFRVFMMSALPILVPGQDRPVVGRGYEARGHVYFSGIGSPLGLLLALTKA